MKVIAKWTLILWSLFCLFGVFAGMSNVSDQLSTGSEAEQAGAAIGTGCGLFMWVGIWAAIALPALIIYLVSGKKETTPVEIVKSVASHTEPSKLCIHCGKYHDVSARFCPHCGKQDG